MTSAADIEALLCPVCQGTHERQPLCAKHGRELHAWCRSLPMLSRLLDLKARKQLKHGGDAGGPHGALASAPLPLDAHALDVQSDVLELLQQAGDMAGLWVGDSLGKAASTLRSHADDVCGSAGAAEAYRLIRWAVRLMERETRVEPERKYVGHCLNSLCHEPLYAPDDAVSVRCEACGSVWEPEAVRLMERNRLAGVRVTMRPKQLADWCAATLGVRVPAHSLGDALRYGSLRSVPQDGGRYEVCVADLLDYATGFTKPTHN